MTTSLKAFITIIIFITTIAALHAEQVVVDKADLPPELVVKLETQRKLAETKQQLQAVSEFAGIGKEIGVAVNEGLTAVTEQTAKFADTVPGKFTMAMIAWKVMSKDVFLLLSNGGALMNGILGVIIGIPFLIFVEGFFIWMWKSTVRPRLKITKPAEKDTPAVTTYEDTWFTNSNTDDDVKSWFIAFWWAGLILSNIIVFTALIF